MLITLRKVYSKVLKPIYKIYSNELTISRIRLRVNYNNRDKFDGLLI